MSTVNRVVRNLAVLHYRTFIHEDTGTAISVFSRAVGLEHVVLHEAVLQDSVFAHIHADTKFRIGEIAVLYGEALEGTGVLEGSRLQ